MHDIQNTGSGGWEGNAVMRVDEAAVCDVSTPAWVPIHVPAAIGSGDLEETLVPGFGFSQTWPLQPRGV